MRTARPIPDSTLDLFLATGIDLLFDALEVVVVTAAQVARGVLSDPVPAPRTPDVVPEPTPSETSLAFDPKTGTVRASYRREATPEELAQLDSDGRLTRTVIPLTTIGAPPTIEAKLRTVEAERDALVERIRTLELDTHRAALANEARREEYSKEVQAASRFFHCLAETANALGITPNGIGEHPMMARPEAIAGLAAKRLADVEAQIAPTALERDVARDEALAAHQQVAELRSWLDRALEDARSSGQAAIDYENALNSIRVALPESDAGCHVQQIAQVVINRLQAVTNTDDYIRRLNAELASLFRVYTRIWHLVAPTPQGREHPDRAYPMAMDAAAAAAGFKLNAQVPA